MESVVKPLVPVAPNAPRKVTTRKIKQGGERYIEGSCSGCGWSKFSSGWDESSRASVRSWSKDHNTEFHGEADR